MSNFFCSLCNVNLTDENMLQIHLGTVQHQAMLQKKQSENFGSGHQPMSVDGAKYYCELCNAKCNCEATFQSHINGSKHAKKLRDLGLPPQQQQQSIAMEGVNHPFTCELCDTKCPNEAMYQKHINGAKHTKKVKDLEFQRKKEAKDPEVYCQLCDLILHPELMQTHLNGMKHLAALRAAGDPAAAAIIQSKKNKLAEVKALQSVKQKGAQSLAPMLPTDSNNSQSLSKMPKSDVQKLVSKRQHMKCSVCDVPEFTTFSQAEHHFNSKAHRLAYQQHQQEIIKAKGKLCELCSVIVSSDELLEAHCRGYKHTLRSMNGQIPPGHVYYEKFLKHQENIRNLKANKSASAASSAYVVSSG